MSSLINPQSGMCSSVLKEVTIQSKKLLQGEFAKLALGALVTISKQTSNPSAPLFERAKFTAPKYVIIIDEPLVFTSLSCTLIVLSAAMALQWVINYDMGLNTSSPRKRTLQRHMRWDRTRRRMIEGVISSVPLILFVGLILFFVGIGYWIWQVNKGIPEIVMGRINAVSFPYVITNGISMLHHRCIRQEMGSIRTKALPLFLFGLPPLLLRN